MVDKKSVPSLTKTSYMALSLNDLTSVLCGSRRADPIAVKTIWHAVAEMHQRYRSRLDIGGVEDSEVACVLLRPPHRREQPAVALGSVLASLHKDRLGDAVAKRQEIFAEALALAVDVRDAGKAFEHRQFRIGAGVPAVMVGKSRAAIVDARKFAGEIVEIALLEAVGIA